MSYYLFHANPEHTFCIDEKGTQGALGEHLEYINNGGSPDCWDCIHTDSRSEAIHEAKESGLHLFVVDDYLLRVVGIVNS